MSRSAPRILPGVRDQRAPAPPTQPTQPEEPSNEPAAALSHRFRELPGYASWNDWDNLRAVRRAIRELEGGIFNTAAQVVDAMDCDDRLSGCLLQRCEAIPSLPVSIEPRTKADAEPTAAQLAVAKQLATDWPTMVPDDVATELQKWGVMLGAGFAQVTWPTWERPKLEVWHPRFFHWRWDTRSFWVTTADDGMQEVLPGTGRWVVYAPYGITRAWMRGAIRSLYVPWLLRQWALRDWGRYGEMYGAPFRKAKTPAAGNEQDKQRFLREVANIGANAVVRVPISNDPAQTYDVELVEAASTGGDTFEHLIDKCDASMAIRLLGQNLSTEVKSGALASTTVHDTIKDDVIEADAERLGEALTKQLLEPWAEFNLGSREEAPTVTWVVKPPEDKKGTGDAFKAVGDGLSSLRAAGAKPDVDAVLEKMGIPVTGPAEEPQPEPDGDEKPGGKGEKSPAEKLSAQLEAFSGLKPTGADKGQAYVDAVADKAVASGSKAMRPDVIRVLTAVLSANSYDELRADLVQLFGDMEPDAFATVLQRAQVMSELAGMLSAVEDTRR